jgi:2-C-methyl-D-erythritol 4-phosphate cytidylyltransferase
VGVPVVDTVKQVNRGTGKAHIRATLPREKLVLAQTPQVFRYDLLARAFQSAREDGFIGTDESSLVERMDIEVSVVPGSDRNIKITKPGDMSLAHTFLHEDLAKDTHS